MSRERRVLKPSDVFTLPTFRVVLKVSSDLVILRALPDGPPTTLTGDQLGSSGNDESRLERSRLAAAIGPCEHNKRVRFSVRAVKIKIQPFDSAEITDRQGRDGHFRRLRSTEHLFLFYAQFVGRMIELPRSILNHSRAVVAQFNRSWALGRPYNPRSLLVVAQS